MHSQRQSLHNELHARPSLYFEEPAHVYHLAFIGDPFECKTLVEKLCHSSVDPHCVQGISRLGGHPFKWEQHAEFFTVTWVVPCEDGLRNWTALPSALSETIEPHLPKLINSVQIMVGSDAEWRQNLENYSFRDPCGSVIGGSDAVVWSDFRLCPEGTNRFLFINKGLNAYRQGRMIRRLLEIETYRMMASLSLPVARTLSARLSDFDKALVDLSRRNAELLPGEAKVLLADITKMSADVVRETAKHRHRFSATQAYAQLVFERLAELRESHVGGYQRLGVFIDRRFKPTVRYCAATEQLAKSLANLGDLLLARVQVEMEEQNAEILKSLNARADSQVKTQHAVEGLSIIAITYYLLSLFKMSYLGLHALGLDVASRTAILFMGPVAVAALLAILLRIRKARTF
jgi:uncharacterized membrane-anchored protein